MSEENPLNRLRVDEEAYNRKILAEILDGKIGIGQDSGEIIVRSDFHRYNTKAQIVLWLLGKKAAADLDSSRSDGASGKEIAERLSSSSLSVRKYTDSQEFITRNKKSGEFFIPDSQVQEAVNYLKTY